MHTEYLEFLFNKDAKSIIVDFVNVFKTFDQQVENANKVIDYLDEIIENFKPQVIYSCGPEIVLKLVGQSAQKHNLEAQIAMEKVFACQIGVCRGCVINVIKEGRVQNATICHDGPVFKASEVVWE